MSDKSLWPALDKSPFSLLWRLGCLASFLVLLVAFLIAAAGLLLGFEYKPYWLLLAPVVAWVVLLGLPSVFASRGAVLSLLDAISATTEGWKWRALAENEIEAESREIVRPVIVNAASARLVDSSVETIPEMSEDAAQGLTLDLKPRPKSWKLPNGVKIPEEQLITFCYGVVTRGLARSAWVPKKLEREEYQGLIALFVSSGLIEGRKAGFAGRLVFEDVEQILQILGLKGD